MPLYHSSLLTGSLMTNLGKMVASKEPEPSVYDPNASVLTLQESTDQSKLNLTYSAKAVLR
jgi:hypothetical protein